MKIPAVTWRKRAGLIAAWRVGGCSAERACRLAGYGEGTCRKKAYAIAKRPEVRAALVKINQGLSDGTNIWDKLVSNPETDMETLVKVTRIRVKQALGAYNNV